MSQIDGLNRTLVPFLDLRPTYAGLKESMLDAFAELIDSGRFTNGSQVAEFEGAFADACGVAHCVGTSSGLDALRFALIAAGLERGGEVIVPANTFVATFEAITQAGGIPVPVDVTEADYNLDVRAAATAVTERTHAIVPVHLYGQMSDMCALDALAQARGIALVEDACQAHGAERDGVRPGMVGEGAAFSFYPGKNLGAAGDAGGLITRDPEIARIARMLREHGQRDKYVHEIEGYTARLDTIQAVVLLHKLPHVIKWTAERRRIASAYHERLAGIGDLQLPPVPVGSSPVWHLFVVRTAAAEELQRFLTGRGIASGRHYPIPAHLSPAYGHLGLRPGALPVAERLSREVLSLPIFPGLSEEQLAAVVDAVGDFFAGA